MSDSTALLLTISGIFALLGLLGVVVAIVVYRRRLARLPPAAVPEIPREAYDFVALDETLPPFDRRHPTLDAQTPAWRAELAASGRAMAKNGVHTVVYAHGTFVGSDPIGVAAMLQGLHPSLGVRLAAKTRKLIKKSNALVTRDLGNFSSDYLALARTGLHRDIGCLELEWSSANNHFARLEGALTLLSTLMRTVGGGFDAARQRFLLVGHSHAGQVFALFTQLLGDGDLYAELGKVIEEERLLPPGDLAKARALLRPVAIDFVTLGTAPNYPWHLGPKHRLLHVINHRGDEPEGSGLAGVLVTKSGDYIQQYGLAGSDTLALTSRERHANRRLNDVLGVGVSMTALVKNLFNRRRLSTQGFTYLVDFRDGGTGAPNFLKTFFGHAVYTRYDVMLYLHRLIAEHFYGR